MKENRHRNVTDEKIRYYVVRYQSGKATAEEIKTLVRLLYEEKNERKKAVWILNECMGKAKESSLQLLYLYEALRVLRYFQSELYEKYENALYRKLEQLAAQEANRSYADISVLYSCMEDVCKRKDFVCYDKLESIWKSYWNKDIAWKKRFRKLKRTVQWQKWKDKTDAWISSQKRKTTKQTMKKRQIETKVSKGIIAVFLVGCICFGCVFYMTLPTVRTYLNRQKDKMYAENHDMLLTSEELLKLKRLEQKYRKHNDFVIRYCQLAEEENVELEEAENSVCLLIRQREAVMTYELFCKGLSEEQQENLWNSIVIVLEGDEEDYKKCREYFRLVEEITKE